MKLYLAGPMTGIEHFNFPAFDEAADLLRDAGHTVFNPADNDRLHGFEGIGTSGSLDDPEFEGFNLRFALKQDLSWICDHADAIALLPKWQNSKGASAEVALANALGIPWAYVPEFVTGKYRRKLSMAIASP
jgi:nucleoside 2-deoxyribosyltransferase